MAEQQQARPSLDPRAEPPELRLRVVGDTVDAAGILGGLSMYTQPRTASSSAESVSSRMLLRPDPYRLGEDHGVSSR
jgi:hypothetical protein